MVHQPTLGFYFPSSASSECFAENNHLEMKNSYMDVCERDCQEIFLFSFYFKTLFYQKSQNSPS